MCRHEASCAIQRAEGRLLRILRPAVATLVVAVTVASCGDAVFTSPGSGGKKGAPPTVQVTVTPSPLGLDTIASILVVAADSQGLRLAGYSVINTADDSVLATDTTQLDKVKEDTLRATFDPAGLQPVVLRFVGFALDTDSTWVTDTLDVTLRDINAPSVQFVTPTDGRQVPLFDSLKVEVLFADSQAGLSHISVKGVALHGDSAQATDSIVTHYAQQTRTYSTPWTKPTTVDFELAPESNQSEIVLLIAEATDASGNVGADTISVSVGGPWVHIQQPENADTILAGSDRKVSIEATDRSGLTDVWISTIIGPDTATQRLCCSTVQYDTVTDSLTVTMPDSAVDVTFLATARNATSTIMAWDAVTVRVETAAVVTDTAAPTVSVDLTTGDRIELTDSLNVVVSGKDASGLDSMAMTLVAMHTAASDTLVFDSTIAFASPMSGTVRGTFRFDMRQVYRRINALLPATVTLPDTVSFQLYAFAYDPHGNCGAAALGAASSVVPGCGTLSVGGTSHHVATGSSQAASTVTVVHGLTVMLPTPGIIADAVVDTNSSRPRLYLSNISDNAVEGLNLSANPDGNTFLSSPVQVGSEPWGLFLDNSGDTLIVANSGGTNLSLVALTAAGASEANADRILTPNAVFYQITVSGGDTEPFKYSGTTIDFSDRPQFVAQDSTGRILYSTVPTSAASDGTIRYVDRDPDHNASTANDPEVHVLFDAGAVTGGDDTKHAIANVDSLVLLATGETNGFSDFIQVFGHRPGDRSTPIISVDTTIDAAVQDYNAKMLAQLTTMGIAADSNLYYAFHMRGTWNTSQFTMSDTTFVAASGNRGVIAFGEGATAPTGRIILYDAATSGPTPSINQIDLVNNAAERVLGVGLNYSGTLGVARGLDGAYFFSGNTTESDPLRLQGLYTEGLNQGGAGATMHPRHTDFRASNDSTLAFVGAHQSIKVIDTFHFFDVADLDIRDTVVGPLRASLPLPNDNAALTAAGLTCSGATVAPACIVVKLYGVTDNGGVVIVNVRQRDLHTP